MKAVLLAGALLALPAAASAEICRFAGTTSHDGRMAVTTEVTQDGATLTVNVAATLTVSGWLADVEYLGQEISTWRDRELQSVAVNQRTIIDGRIKRQQWDVFVRGPAGLAARRVQAKTLADFRRLHPGFVGHWALSSFGQNWVGAYAGAPPERRPDLDLPGPLPPGLKSPLAFAFYWSRFLPAGGGVAPVFLPGFKRDKQTEIAYGPATSGEGWGRWLAQLRHPGLADSPASFVAAWISPDRYLLQLAFDVHARQGSGQALIRAQGCQGVQIAP